MIEVQILYDAVGISLFINAHGNGKNLSVPSRSLKIEEQVRFFILGWATSLIEEELCIEMSYPPFRNSHIQILFDCLGKYTFLGNTPNRLRFSDSSSGDYDVISLLTLFQVLKLELYSKVA